MEMKILEEAGLGDKSVAFGLGLERLAMVLFDVPDIVSPGATIRASRNSSRRGCSGGGIDMAKFKPCHGVPPCLKDVSFWLPEEAEKFTENNCARWSGRRGRWWRR